MPNKRNVYSFILRTHANVLSNRKNKKYFDVNHQVNGEIVKTVAEIIFLEKTKKYQFNISIENTN